MFIVTLLTLEPCIHCNLALSTHFSSVPYICNSVPWNLCCLLCRRICGWLGSIHKYCPTPGPLIQCKCDSHKAGTALGSVWNMFSGTELAGKELQQNIDLLFPSLPSFPDSLASPPSPICWSCTAQHPSLPHSPPDQ